MFHTNCACSGCCTMAQRSKRILSTIRHTLTGLASSACTRNNASVCAVWVAGRFIC